MVTSESEGIIWDEYVQAQPLACGYQLLAWRHVIESAFGHRTVYLMAKDNEEKVHGVLPLVYMSSRLFGRFLVSVPFVNYGGVLADSGAVQRALLEEAVNLAKELGAAHIELRHQQELELDWPYKRHKVSMRLALPADFEALWSMFPSKLRNRIRRAQREGMIVRVGGVEMLDDFYRVFSRNMRDLGTPVYGRQFFEAILQVFPKDARIMAIYLQDRAVAAGLLYGFRRTLEIPWSSSDRRYNRLVPNMLLYSSMLEYACGQGFRMFDFGRSSPGSGTYRFKEQWGAKAVPLYWYYWLRNGELLPELNPNNKAFSMPIRVWQKLPITLTRLIGPHIVKHLP